jgi:hypothetical protein
MDAYNKFWRKDREGEGFEVGGWKFEVRGLKFEVKLTGTRI